MGGGPLDGGACDESDATVKEERNLAQRQQMRQLPRVVPMQMMRMMQQVHMMEHMVMVHVVMVHVVMEHMVMEFSTHQAAAMLVLQREVQGRDEGGVQTKR